MGKITRRHRTPKHSGSVPCKGDKVQAIISDILSRQMSASPAEGPKSTSSFVLTIDNAGAHPVTLPAITPADEERSLAGLPKATGLDDGPLDPAFLDEGLPVLDGEKLDAYPQQRDLLAITDAYIKKSATGLWGEYEPFLLLRAEEYARDFFEERLAVPEIKLGHCRSPRTLYGHYQHRGDHGIVGEITINHRMFHGEFPGVELNESTKEGFKRLIADILLHEMVHAYCHTVLDQPESSYRGHGPVFANQCNRIGMLLGLNAVKHGKSRKSSEIGMEKCNYWPHCVRNEDFYMGAVVEIPEEEEPRERGESTNNWLGMDGPGPGEILSNLFHLAERTKDTAAGRKVIAHALVYYMRLTIDEKSLAHFPANLVEPEMPNGDPVPAPT